MHTTRASTPTMDPKTWSKLPTELLLPIIRFANQDYASNDTKSRDILWQKWIKVVRGNRLLYSGLLSQQWEEVDFAWTGLILSLDEDAVDRNDDIAIQNLALKRRYSVKLLQRNSASASSIFKSILKMDHEVCPAHYVQNLHLNFHLNEDELNHCLPPSHRTIQHTLRILLPRMKSLRSVSTTGPPSQTILDSFTHYNHPQLRKLHIGSTDYNYLFRSAHGEEALNLRDWTKLRSLNLTELAVSQLELNDVVTMAELIPQLRCLQTLKLRVRQGDQYNCADAISKVTPLQTLFFPDATNQDGSVSSLFTRLPDTLKTLSLEDLYHTSANSLQIPYPKDQEHSQCKLKVLTTKFDNYCSPSNILEWFPNAVLERIFILPVPSYGCNSADELTKSLAMMDTMVSTHQSTLKGIVIGNAWRLHPEFVMHFLERWNSLFHVTDLVLGTKGLQNPNCSTESHVELYAQDFKHTLFGCNEDTRRWGSNIQRLSLEEPWLSHKLNLESLHRFPWPTLQNLRILIISPLHVCRKTRVDHFPIARALMTCASRSLRIIMLCQQLYWIDHWGENRDRRLVHWTSAALGNDERIKRDIAVWMTPEDNEFLSSLPQMSGDRRVFKEQFLEQKDSSDHILIQACNFLVVRRRN